MASTLSDRELVSRCRAGDQQAWAELVERFSRYVYAICVQAFRLRIDRLRAGARERPVADEELIARETEDTLALLDDALAVHEALAASPGHCREILDRFFARDESYKTIGEALELPSGTIASRISRCLGKLRSALEGRNSS